MFESKSQSMFLFNFFSTIFSISFFFRRNCWHVKTLFPLNSNLRKITTNNPWFVWTLWSLWCGWGWWVWKKMDTKGPKEWCDGYFGTRAFWMVLPQTFLRFLFVHHFFSIFLWIFILFLQILFFFLSFSWYDKIIFFLFFLSFQNFWCFVLVRVTLVQGNVQRKFCFTLLVSDWVAKDDSFCFFLGRKKEEKKWPHIISNCDCFTFKSFNAREKSFIHATTCP